MLGQLEVPIYRQAGPMTWKIFIPLSDEEYQINNSGDSLSASNHLQTVDFAHVKTDIFIGDVV